MFTPRRFYIYAVSAISLQAVVTALIALFRNLLVTGLDPARSAIALQITIVVVSLPLFLVHWLWGLRLARREAEERVAVLRRLYLYAMLAAFLGPLVNSSYNILSRLLASGLGASAFQRLYPRLPAGEFILYHLIGAIILAAFWFYHVRVVGEESTPETETGSLATVRRLYVLGFSAAGLVMVTIAAVNLLEWILFQVGAGLAQTSIAPFFEFARLLVGGGLWLVFWLWAERLFARPVGDERESALRKFYLLSIVFVAAMTAVTTAGFMLASLFRRLLQVRGEPGDIREAIAILVPMTVLWAYHGLVLREDTRRAAESPRQAGVKRLYSYLVAGIGLSAVLTGLGGVLGALILTLEEGTLGSVLKEQVSWAAAALIAGLPVWGWPWSRAQARASSQGSEGDAERHSVVRRIYLYFFLFVATMTVLSAAIFLLSQFVGVLLGEAAPGIAELGTALSFGAIAVGLWLYHGSALRGDRRYRTRALAGRLEATRVVVVVDAGEGEIGNAVAAELGRRLPGIALDTVLLPAGGEGVSGATPEADVENRLKQAGLIVSPWTAMVQGVVAAAHISQTILDSPAKKLLYPTRIGGYEWAGVDRWDSPVLIRQVVSAAMQILQGQEVKPSRPLGVGAIIGILLGGLLLLLLIGAPLAFFLF